MRLITDGSEERRKYMDSVISQGQQKTYLIALKFAQFDFIKKLSDYNPILLLDDIFVELEL